MKFSIIVPSFNQSAYLSKTLDSILSQPEITECLVFDANSSDGSKEILKKYDQKYPKLWFQSKKDAGQVDAINKGIKKSSGDIVAYINSDDYYLPSGFKHVAEYFQNHPEAKWLVADCGITAKNLSWSFWLKQLVPYQKFPSLIKVFNPINQPSVFIRKEFVNQVGVFDSGLHYAFDYDYWLRATKISPPHRLKITTSVFRIHPFSKGNRGYHKQFQEDFMVVKRHTSNPLLIAIHFLLWKFTIIGYTLLKK